MTITKSTLTALFVSLILAVTFAALWFHTPARADIYNGTVLGQASTTASFSITTSTRILATTTPNPINGGRYTRVYASICNLSATPVALALNADSPVGPNNITTLIASSAGYSSCYEITDRNLYQGSITASSTTATAAIVNVADYVQ